MANFAPRGNCDSNIDWSYGWVGRRTGLKSAEKIQMSASAWN
jgi:hypothetical protein